jgi:hypothetical protein
MAEGDVLKEELPAGSEDGGSRVQDDFEHPFMLYSGLRNRNDTNTDGIFGSHNRDFEQPLRGILPTPDKTALQGEDLPGQ